MSGTQKQIIEYGKKLASLDPGNAALKRARDWWRAGCYSRYSNQDFDILNSLVCEVTRIEKSWG